MPNVIVIAGPNGAGKSTIAPQLLRDVLDVPLFVNADQIAAGLAAIRTSSADFEAGRFMLRQVRTLAAQRADFAFESTLSSRSLAPMLRGFRNVGYSLAIVYLWLQSAVIARDRVHHRGVQGGHSLPVAVIERRYRRSLANFFTLYRPVADYWRFYDNSRSFDPRLVAEGRMLQDLQVSDPETWQQAQRRGAFYAKAH
jgi:predicted ABC-type ATPase